MLTTIIDLIKGLLATNAARVIAYSGTAALFATGWLAGRLGVELSPEVTTAIQVIAVAIATELIRRFVYSQATVEAITSNG